MRRFWKRFFWGAPSHKVIAWAGAFSGVGLVVLASFLFTIGQGELLFLLAILFLGLANWGWAAELLPRRRATVAGWSRVGRWLCALIGTVLAALSLGWGLTFGVGYGLMIAAMGLAQVFEFAPNGPANRP